MALPKSEKNPSNKEIKDNNLLHHILLKQNIDLETIFLHECFPKNGFFPRKVTLMLSLY